MSVLSEMALRLQASEKSDKSETGREKRVSGSVLGSVLPGFLPIFWSQIWVTKSETARDSAGTELPESSHFFPFKKVLYHRGPGVAKK